MDIIPNPQEPRVPTAGNSLSRTLRGLVGQAQWKIWKAQGLTPAEKEFEFSKLWNAKYQDTLRTEQKADTAASLEQLNQLGPGYVAGQTATAEAGAPGFSELRGSLMGEATSHVGKGIAGTPLEAFYQSKIRAGQAARGLFDSPLGSEQEAMALSGLEEAQRMQNNAFAAGLMENDPLFRFSAATTAQTPQMFGVNAANYQPMAPIGFGEMYGSQRASDAATYAKQYGEWMGASKAIGTLPGGMFWGGATGASSEGTYAGSMDRNAIASGAASSAASSY